MVDTNRPENKKKSGIFKRHFTSTSIILTIILIAGALFRFHRLTKQSLWSDEIQTMLDVTPGFTWHQFMNEIKNGEGVHPPLYFILARYFTLIFGYSDWVARSLSALAGVASIWAIFLLGKEIKNEKLGLTSAALMCVNYFNIYQSQEARMYTFLCLFTTLSYLYFLKVCRYIKVRDAVLFIITTACLIYTHYFGAFVVVSELVMAVFFLLQEEKRRKRLLIMLFASELIIFITFFPWLPYLQPAVGIHSFWIAPVTPKLLVDIFNEYFYFSDTISWAIVAIWAIYLVGVFVNIKGFKNLKANPDNFSFIFVSITLVVSLGLPYLRSVLVVPMLVTRYTIIILPTLIISIASGIETIPKNIIRYPLLGVFLWFSMHYMIIEKGYYRKPVKTQFRELTAYVTSGDQNYAIINEFTPSQQQYYLKKDNFMGQLLTGKKENIIDSILHKSSKQYDIDTFWLVGIFGDPPLTIEKQKNLDSAYIMIKDSTFLFGWAQLYVSDYKASKVLNYNYFDASEVIASDGTKVAAIWSKNVITKPIFLKKGKYNIIIMSRGTPVQKIFPHNNVFINDSKIGDFYSETDYKKHDFPYDLKRDTNVIMKIDMDNDANGPGEDRNTFIYKIFILKRQM